MSVIDEPPTSRATTPQPSAVEPAAARQAAREQAHELEQRKRWLYAVVLGLALMATVVSWLLREPDDAFLGRVYPVFGLAAAAGIGLVLWRRLPLRLVEASLLGLGGVMVLARLAWHYHAPGAVEDRLLVLTGGHYWAVGVLLVAGFVVFDRHRGTRFAVSVWVLATLIALTGAWGEVADGTLSTEALLHLGRVHVFLAALIALVAMFAVLREQLQRSWARAEVLQELAETDATTGLANRRRALAELERLRTLSDRYARPVSVVLMDLDHFKHINDRYGHAAGDEALRGAARAMADCAREADTVARWGGEELLVVAPETTLAQAAALAERARAAIRRVTVDDATLSGSLGVAELAPGEGVDALLRRVDARLYAAKRQGRDRVVSAG